MIGERILNYRIESLIGEGGVGKVYLATHAQLGRKVAIKVLNQHLVDNSEVRERFRQEATTLSNLQHLNIITLYDYLEEERGLFLIMEFAQGSALDDYIRKISGPIPEQKAVFFFNQILEGFAYAHQQGVVHRDIKPSNIIITQEADVKILDFGIAKILKSDAPNMTRAGARLGTVLYMSPEQVKGSNVDARSDVYSLGITLFQMLTGRCPYDEHGTEFEIFNKIVNEDLPSAKSFYPGVSDRMQAIIDKATAKDPAMRFQSCEEFKQALNNQQNAPSLAQTQIVSPTTSSTVSSNSGQNTANAAATPKKRSSGTGYLLLYILLGVLVALSGYVIVKEFVLSPKNPEEENISLEESDSTRKNTEENEDPLYEEDEENTDEEPIEEEPSFEEEVLDSLGEQKKRTQSLIDIFKKERKRDLLKGLIVDGQFESDDLGEFVIQVTVANRQQNVDFKDIVIEVSYFNENGDLLKTREQELEPIKAGKAFTFKLRENIEAAKFTCKLKSADFKEEEPSPTLDSLNQVVEELDEQIKDIKRRISDEV